MWVNVRYSTERYALDQSNRNDGDISLRVRVHVAGLELNFVVAERPTSVSGRWQL